MELLQNYNITVQLNIQLFLMERTEDVSCEWYGHC